MSDPAAPERFSAGVVVVRRAPGQWLYLLLRAWGHWDFPKGAVEPGETPLAAAVREVREEADIGDLEFLWGEQYRETAPYRHGKVARYYLACTRSTRVRLPVSAQLGRPEHHEGRWVDLAGAEALIPPRLAPILAWAAATVATP